MTKAAFGERMTGGYEAPILAEPKGGPIPSTSPFNQPTNRLIVNVDPGDIDLSAVARQFDARLEDLMRRWRGVTRKQRDQILDQIRAAINNDDLAALARLSTSTAEATDVLLTQMTEMANEAALQMSREASRQGARIDPVATDSATLARSAAAMASFLADAQANAAGREALRRWHPTATGDDVADAVRLHLEGLSDTFAEVNLGGVLHSAQNTGRLGTALAGPSVALYASEVNDKNTCPPCAQVDGRWIGNSDDPDIEAKVAAIYPNGGYVDCEGGVKCRGTIVAIHRPQQTGT